MTIQPKACAIRFFAAMLFILITGYSNSQAQTKKVVLKDFTFYPFVNQQSEDNPLELPYESSSASITIFIDATEDFETVEDFMNISEKPLKKSPKVETINQLSSGWIIEESHEDEDKWMFTGMIKNNATGTRLIIGMEFGKGNGPSEKNVLAMFRSFRPNQAFKGNASNTGVTPVNTNTGNANSNTNNTQTNTTNANTVSIADILAAQNAYRAAVGVPPLTWSAELANWAQAWAENLVSRNCAFEHRPYSGAWAQKYGENIFSGSGGGYTILSAIKNWGDEKANYNHSNNSCTGGMCGHYTQLVWKNTTQVGCAIVKCANGALIMVCNYNPPGNINGQPPY